MAESSDTFSIRLSADLLAWIEAEAKAEQRSRNGQIIYMLEAYRQQQTSGDQEPDQPQE